MFGGARNEIGGIAKRSGGWRLGNPFDLRGEEDMTLWAFEKLYVSTAHGLLPFHRNAIYVRTKAQKTILACATTVVVFWGDRVVRI